MPDEQRPIRRRRRRIAEKPAVEPQEPKPRIRRRTLPPGVKATPAWKVAGDRPVGPDPEEETPDVAGN